MSMSGQILGQPEQGSYNLESDGEKIFFNQGLESPGTTFLGSLKVMEFFLCIIHVFCLQSNLSKPLGISESLL